MPEEQELLEKLEKWVEEHQEAADVPHINITTQKEFTIRNILGQLKQEQESGIAIVDEETLAIKDQIKSWIGR